MLTINHKQIDALAEVPMTSFVKQCMELLCHENPFWAQDNSAEQQEQFVRETITWSQEHEIHSESNIQQLLHRRVKHSLALDLPSKLEACLSPFTVDENYRVHRFVKFLEGGVKKRISLNDNVEALRREYV